MDLSRFGIFKDRARWPAVLVFPASMLLIVVAVVASNTQHASAMPALAPGYCDGGEGVYLYQDIDYRGTCDKFTGDSAYAYDWKMGNDQASSIQMVGSWTATVYVDGNYQGGAITFNSSYSNFTHLNTGLGNDNASSIRVMRGGDSSGGSPNSCSQATVTGSCQCVDWIINIFNLYRYCDGDYRYAY